MEIEYSRGGLTGWIQERWFEFRQGHTTYLGFALSFINFVLITYNLFLQEVFTSLSLFQFCVIFGLVYTPVSIIIGRFHIDKQARYDTGMISNENPVFRAMMDELREIRKTLQEIKEGLNGG